MKEIYNLLSKIYNSELAEGIQAESESDILAFEEKYQVKIPDDYRWLLKEFGGCNFSADPHIYSLKELDWAYSSFLEIYSEYKESDYDIPDSLDPFPIGGFGEGSIAVLDQNTQKILMLIHDCAENIPFEDVAENLTELMKSHINSIIAFENWYNS